MNFKEIKDRHDSTEPEPVNYWERRDWWRGNWNTGQQAHKDRGELIAMLETAENERDALQRNIDQFIITAPSYDQMLIWQQNFAALKDKP